MFLCIPFFDQVIGMFQGSSPPLFVPQNSFEMLVKRQIENMMEPSLECIDLIHAELKKMIARCTPKNDVEKQRFPKVYERMSDIVTKLLISRLVPTREFVENLINIQLAFINTKHPEFADKSLDEYLKVQSVQEGRSTNSSHFAIEAALGGMPHVSIQADEVSFLPRKMQKLSMKTLNVDEHVQKSRFQTLTEREKHESELVGKYLYCINFIF